MSRSVSQRLKLGQDLGQAAVAGHSARMARGAAARLFQPRSGLLAQGDVRCLEHNMMAAVPLKLGQLRPEHAEHGRAGIPQQLLGIAINVRAVMHLLGQRFQQVSKHLIAAGRRRADHAPLLSGDVLPLHNTRLRFGTHAQGPRLRLGAQIQLGMRRIGEVVRSSHPYSPFLSNRGVQ